MYVFLTESFAAPKIYFYSNNLSSLKLQSNIANIEKYASSKIIQSNSSINNCNKNDLILVDNVNLIELQKKTNNACNIIAIFITSYDFYQSNNNSKNITGIFIDPNPNLQIQLINKLFLNSKKIIILYSSFPIQKFINTNTQIYFKKIESINDIFNSLQESNSILLATPDSFIYNSSTIKNILLTSYKSKIPIIGFSPNMVKAGAVATIYVTDEDMFFEINETIKKFLITGYLSKPHFVSKGKILINSFVSNSFDIPSDFSKEMQSLKFEEKK